jgi:uncharacterized sulfatase
VRTDRYKYVVHAQELNPWNEDGTNAQYSEKYLFDMKNDPLEKNNLVNDPAYASVKEELKRILLEYSKEADENITIRGN